MTPFEISDDGWTLRPTTMAEFDQLMTWFPDAQAVDIWGGPVFRYPFTRETFLEDCHVDMMVSYSLLDANDVLAAFGQLYERHGRGHLARLVSNPVMRRQGAGKRLVDMMIEAIRFEGCYDEASLFVYRDNEPARECYLSLGFSVAEYPDDAPLEERCYFLTRPLGKAGELSG